MLIEKLADNRTIMDRTGVQAYLVNYISNAIVDRSSDHPIFKAFAAMDSGTRESAVEALVLALFDRNGEPTIAVRDLYYEFFKVKMNAFGGHYYFDQGLDLS